MRVAVAIVAYRNLDDILGCLAALERSDHTNFEVVICENGGPEAYDRLASAIPRELAAGQRVRAICASDNPGFAGGVNLCIETASDADAWWVLNPDTEPADNALSAMIARLERRDCEAVGSVLVMDGGVIQSLGGRWRWLFARAVSLGFGRTIAELAELSTDIEQRQNYLNGASMLVNRAFWERAGPMREDYFLYCEEVEWCLRARARGLGLGFAPDAVVLHHQGTTTGKPSDVRRQGRLPVYLNERNRLLLTRDVAPALFPAAVLMALALIFLRFARRRAWRQLGYALEGWRAGLKNERGRPTWV